MLYSEEDRMLCTNGAQRWRTCDVAIATALDHVLIKKVTHHCKSCWSSTRQISQRSEVITMNIIQFDLLQSSVHHNAGQRPRALRLHQSVCRWNVRSFFSLNLDTRSPKECCMGHNSQWVMERVDKVWGHSQWDLPRGTEQGWWRHVSEVKPVWLKQDNWSKSVRSIWTTQQWVFYCINY